MADAATPAPAQPGSAKPTVGAPATAPASPATAAAAAAPAPPVAPKAATPPPPPAPKPAGDDARLADIAGATFAITDDEVGVTTVPVDELFLAAGRAKAMGYRILSCLSAYDRTDHFGVLYCFVKPAAHAGEFGELRLRVTMPKKAADGSVSEPMCPSLCDIYPAAEWQEREMFDMYGIRFAGNPDLRRMFLPDDWHGHPMRKDYKEPEQFVTMLEGEDVTVQRQQDGAW